MNRRPTLPFLALAAALATLPAGCGRQDAPPPTARDDELARIQAEPGEVRRLQLLVGWVRDHTVDEIAAALHDATPAQHGELVWLLQLKLRDQNPGADEQTLSELLGRLLYRPDEAISGHDPDDESQGLVRLAEKSPDEALRRLVDTPMHPNKRNDVRNRILGRLAATNPQRALALLDATVGDRRDGLIAIARGWGRADARAALDWAARLPPSEYNRALTGMILEEWSREDPGAVVEHISKLPVTPESRERFVDLIGNWLRQDPDESAKWIQARTDLDPLVAQAAIETLTSTHPALVARLLADSSDETLLRRHGSRLAADWARVDPAAARAWIEQLPPSNASYGIMQAFARNLAHQDLPAALAFFDSLPGHLDTGSIAADIANAFPTGQEALRWLLARPDSDSNRRAVTAAIGRMEFARPADMLTLLGQLPPGPRQLPVYQATAIAWLREDPAAAAKWIGGLQDPEALDAVLKVTRSSWADRDPASLGALLASVAKDERFREHAGRFVSDWSQDDPVAASDWVGQNPTLPLREDEIRRLFENVARHAPDSVERQISALPADSLLHQTALYGAIREISQTSPERAAALFTAHAGRKERRPLIDNVTLPWAKVDPDAAIAWTTSQPVSSTRDAGFEGVIHSLTPTDPHRALSLAEMASTPAARENLIGTAFYVWARHDRTAALAALDQIDISAERRERIRASLNRR